MWTFVVSKWTIYLCDDDDVFFVTKSDECEKVLFIPIYVNQGDDMFIWIYL